MKEFDFMLNKDLFDKIKTLKEKTDKDLSTLIREIIILMLPVLRKKHIYEKRREKDYKFINANQKIRIYLPIEVYNELKLVHDQLNSFSIATLIRELLEIYFVWIEYQGEKEFMKSIELLKKEIEGFRKSKACIVKEGSPDIPAPTSSDDYFLLKFISNFTLKEIKFL
ncbi:MAG TPA: hypothetical protein PLE45_02245 [Spirochaetota bacterium]|nr:hypothetical protein [Spirochaetota bacterium]HOL55968.1 hypothetical protein [Spirochaetota bacterium]HPP03582.1 hypothetical protein [Spirochaetota bacterium]